MKRNVKWMCQTDDSVKDADWENALRLVWEKSTY